MNPRKGQIWKHKTTRQRVKIKAFNVGLVSFTPIGSKGVVEAKGMLPFKEEYELETK